MLLCCPFCGHVLREAIHDGISSCSNCGRVFDTSPFHRLLSACWYVRRNHIGDVEVLMHAGIAEPEAFIAVALAFDANYNHDEIWKTLTRLGISKEYVE